MSKKRKIIFLSLGIIVLLVLVLIIYIFTKTWTEPSDIFGDIVLTTDKREYEKGEEVKITIKNNTEGQVEFWAISIGQVKHKENTNIWNVVRDDVECPCTTLCEKESMYLNPAEEKEFIWNQAGDDCQQVDSGEYGARVDWMDPTAEYRIGENPTSVSNGFIIK